MVIYQTGLDKIMNLTQKLYGWYGRKTVLLTGAVIVILVIIY